MAKAGFGQPKRSTVEVHKCPKCKSPLQRVIQKKVRINHVTYGENGVFLKCTKMKHIKERGEYYEPQCGYERRA